MINIEGDGEVRSLPERGFWAGIGERPWIGLILAVVVVLLDQWTKQIAVTTFISRAGEVTGWFDGC